MTQASEDTVGSVESASVSVETDDVVSGCVKWLSTFPEVLAMIGEDAEGSFLFQWNLGIVIEGTQKAAVVVKQMGSWAAPNIHNTLRFPRVSVEFYVDPLRDAAGHYIDLTEVRRRMNSLYNAVDKRLHRPQAGDQIWGTLRTLECTRLGEPIIYEIPSGDGALRAQVFFGVAVG